MSSWPPGESAGFTYDPADQPRRRTWSEQQALYDADPLSHLHPAAEDWRRGDDAPDSALPPTLPAIPRPARLPTPAFDPPAEIRYDLAEATDFALEMTGRATQARTLAEYGKLYDDVRVADMCALAEARCALVMASRRLGGP